MNGESGKGSDRRKGENLKKFRENYPYADKKLNILPRDSKGNIVWE